MEQSYIKSILEINSILNKINALIEQFKNLTDNYSEEQEKNLINTLVSDSRALVAIIEADYALLSKLIDSFLSKTESLFNNEEKLSTKRESFLEAYNTIKSIVSIENPHATLFDGAAWENYNKLEMGSEFKSVKELLIGRLYSLSKDFNALKHILIGMPVSVLSSAVFAKLEDVITKNINVSDITSLSNVVRARVSTIDNTELLQEIKGQIRNMMGLANGNLALSRKLNISEIDILKGQALTNFLLAGRLDYVYLYAERISTSEKNIALEVSKNLELELAEASVTLNTDFKDSMPIIEPATFHSSRSLGNTTPLALQLSIVNNMEDNSKSEFNFNSVSVNLLDQNDGTLVTVQDAIQAANLDESYNLLILSSVALVLSLSDVLSHNYNSNSLEKGFNLSKSIGDTSILLNNIVSKLDLINKDGEYSVSKDSINTIIKNKDLFLNLIDSNIVENTINITEAHATNINAFLWSFRTASLL